MKRKNVAVACRLWLIAGLAAIGCGRSGGPNATASPTESGDSAAPVIAVMRDAGTPSGDGAATLDGARSETPPGDAREAAAIDAPLDRAALVPGDAPTPGDGGPACGAPGQPCCPGNVCGGGGCCVGCDCVAPGTSCGPLGGACADGSCGVCGGPGQLCCPDGGCTAPGTRCESGVCQSCGTAGNRCCWTEICIAATTICDSYTATCQHCGQTGEPCCREQACDEGGCCYGGACVAPGQLCSTATTGGGTCMAGRCSACGRVGAPCCAGSKCYGDDTSCSDGRCAACGGPGEPCCAISRCAANLTCLGERCQHCGSPGEACCLRGDRCAGGGCCIHGDCIGAGQLCGGPQLMALGTCQGGACRGCGGPGQACCALEGREDLCNDPSTLCQPSAMGGPGLCQRHCGNPGEPCCPDRGCANNGCCVRSVGALDPVCVASGQSCGQFGGTCQNGSCGSCGGAGQLCCDGGCSAAGVVCSLTPSVGRICVAQTGSCIGSR
jgi:hypothetical protein